MSHRFCYFDCRVNREVARFLVLAFNLEMEGAGKSGSPIAESSLRRWARIFRPLSWWFLLVVVLFDIRAHQRLMQDTRLGFGVSLHGKPAEGNSIALLDGQRIVSGDNVTLGRHTFTLYNEKAYPYSTNILSFMGRTIWAMSLYAAPRGRWLCPPTRRPADHHSRSRLHMDADEQRRNCHQRADRPIHR